MSPMVSSASAYAICLPLGYFGHRSFTFRSTRSHRFAGIAYPEVQFIALLIAVAITFTSVGILGLPPTLAFLLAAIGAASVSYLMQRRWVF
jgi:putative flippase GtrA